MMADLSLAEEIAEWKGCSGFLGVLGVMMAEEVELVIAVIVVEEVKVVEIEAASSRAGVKGGLSG